MAVLQPYDPSTDPVIAALIAEAAADPDVLGLVLLGSRALGEVSAESDYDVIFVVTDEAAARQEQSGGQPARGSGVVPPIDTTDICSRAPRDLQLNAQPAWMLPAFADSLVLYDRTGATTRLLDALRRIPEERAQLDAANAYDGYLNQLYRSLKCWRRGNPLGGHLEAALSLDPLLSMLFALERRWRPYAGRLHHHFAHLSGQGWQSGELAAILLDLAATGDPLRQQTLATRVVALMRDRGHHDVYQRWSGKIDVALAWRFDGLTA